MRAEGVEAALGGSDASFTHSLTRSLTAYFLSAHAFQARSRAAAAATTQTPPAPIPFALWALHFAGEDKQDKQAKQLSVEVPGGGSFRHVGREAAGHRGAAWRQVQVQRLWGSRLAWSEVAAGE